MLDPVQGRAAFGIALYRYDVKPARCIGPSSLFLEEQLRRENELFLFAKINAFQRSTPGGMSPVANFDEYYCISVEHDQIKLTAFA
jgi:hypothetical protein